MNWQKIQKTLNIFFLILVGVWIFNTYKFSSTNTQILITQTPQPKVLLATSTPPIVTSKTATTTKTTKKAPAKLKIVEAPKTPIITVLISPPPPEPVPDFEVINTFARKAIVNILCTTKGNELSPISGTGVIISSSGIVLTNAHVGQYLLLQNLFEKDYIQCVLRTGSPAYPHYKVELAYISPLWVNQNKDLLKSSDPQGTGENDFALLRITGMVDGTDLPTQNGLLDLPYITPNTREVMTIGEPVILVSYPAGFLGGLSILRDLNITSGITSIKDFFTFKTDRIDVISVPGTVVSQKGSSGGAVVDKNSTVIGIISTSSNENTTGARNLNAITLGYINRSLQNESGLTLSEYLSSDTAALAQDFQINIAPGLTKIITDELTKTN